MEWALIVGGLFLWAVLSSGGRNWLAPWNCYVIAQVILLGVAYLKLDPLMEDFSLETWIAVILSGASFFCGCLMAVGAFGKIRAASARNSEFDEAYLHLIRMSLLPVFIVFVIGTILSYRSAGGWPVRMIDPEEARRKFAWPGFGPVMCFQLIYVLALSGMAVWKIETRRAWRIIGAIAVAVPVGVGALSGMRFYSFLIIATLILFWDIYKPISLFKLVGAGIGIVGILVAIFLIRIGMFNSDTLRLALRYPEYAKSVCLPFYQYIANNFWNLDWLFRLHDRTHGTISTLGFQSFQGFVYPTHMTFPINDAYNLESRFTSVLKFKALNTTAYQGALFIDFGWTGLLVLPLILGYFSSLAFMKGRSTFGIFDALLYSVLGFSVVFSFFTWIPQQPSWAFGIIYLLILGLLARHQVSGARSLLSQDKA